jgi:hypothetical protein
MCDMKMKQKLINSEYIYVGYTSMDKLGIKHGA